MNCRAFRDSLEAIIRMANYRLAVKLTHKLRGAELSEFLELAVGFIRGAARCLGSRLLNPKNCTAPEKLLRTRTHSEEG